MGQPPLTAKSTRWNIPHTETPPRSYGQRLATSIWKPTPALGAESSAPFFWTDQITSFRYNITVSLIVPELGTSGSVGAKPVLGQLSLGTQL